MRKMINRARVCPPITYKWMLYKRAIYLQLWGVDGLGEFLSRSRNVTSPLNAFLYPCGKRDGGGWGGEYA